MRLIAIVLMVIAALTAMGGHFLTGWNVWMLWAFVAWFCGGFADPWLTAQFRHRPPQ